MPNRKDECPKSDCKKSIHSDPAHFDGEAASPALMLRCVLYQMYVLASSATAMQSDWDSTRRFQHPTLGELTPSEPLKIAALVSFRILYDFLYNAQTSDDFSIADFVAHGGTRPTPPDFVGFEHGANFTKESINKFIAHLTWARINKPHCVPQPKFADGTVATVANAQLLLRNAKRFVDDVCDPANPNQIVLDEVGQGYRQIFEEVFAELLHGSTRVHPPTLRKPNEGRTIAVVGDLYRFLATGDETDGKYAMWEAIVPPGGGPPPHTHSREEESFFILDGEITFTVGDQQIVATAGTFANMPIGSLHSFKNATDKTARMIISVAPAGLEKMFLEVGVPVEVGETPPPPTKEEIERLLAVAPKYGVEIKVPH